MKKIISSLLVFAMMFTTTLPCFAESERLFSPVPQEVPARIGDVRLDSSDEIFEEERSDLTEDLEVINNDSIDIKNKNAGIDKDIRDFLIAIGVFFGVIIGWIGICALSACGGW